MYKVIDSKTSTELNMVRHGWFNPRYELTDNVYSYGLLAYKWWSTRRPTVETANAIWTFRFESFFRTTVLIFDKDEKQIGKVTRGAFSVVNNLAMETGFKANLHKVSFWSRSYVWDSDGYGSIMQIDNPFFKTNYSISIKQSMAPQTMIPLLAFLGVHILIIKQQKKAARAGF